MKKSVSEQIEEQALAVGNDKKLLKKRLLNTRSCLSRFYKPFFKEYTFEFENKRLVSSCGKYFLQWFLRNDPLSPPSYYNQQLSEGVVYLFENQEEKS
jgi:hypothetical protein